MISNCGKAVAFLSTLLLGTTLMTSANAQYVVLNDLTGFSGSEALIDFEGIGVNGDPVPSVDGVLFALSPSGLPPRLGTADTTTRPFGPQGTGAIDPFVFGASSNPYDDLTIAFPGPVNRVGFVINANVGNTVDVTARYNGVVVALIPFSTAPGFNFFGFETDYPFNEILIEIGNAQGFGFWRLDNLRYELFDPDTDGDGVPDIEDNCPSDPNPSQEDFDMDGEGDACDEDVDGDGVGNDNDFCEQTVIPEGVPTVQLRPSRWALIDDDFVFDTVIKGKGKGPNRSYTVEDTAGCSCEQIIDAQGLGLGHTYHGCSISAMDDWVELVNP